LGETPLIAGVPAAKRVKKYAPLAEFTAMPWAADVTVVDEIDEEPAFETATGAPPAADAARAAAPPTDTVIGVAAIVLPKDARVDVTGLLARVVEYESTLSVQ
jgi:hypothetical protein